MILDGVDPAVKEGFETILHCFGGSDGGISFIQLSKLIRRMDAARDSENEVEAECARRTLELVMRMGKLIEIANGGPVV